jgi:hypothetical protein
VGIKEQLRRANKPPQRTAATGRFDDVLGWALDASRHRSAELMSCLTHRRT